MCVCVCVCVCVQGMDADVAERLALWTFNVPTITISSDRTNQFDQPAALRNTLQQLADLQGSDVTNVVLQGWDCQAMADVLPDSAAEIQHLRLCVHTPGPLTDVLLRAVLRVGPCVRGLVVDSLDLQSDHSDVVWPWSGLSMEWVDVAQLLRLSAPGSGAELGYKAMSLASCGNLDEVRVTHTHRHTHTHTCIRLERPAGRGYSRT